MKPASVPGEMMEGSVHLRRKLLNGESKVGGEEFIAEHKLRHAELQVCTILGRGERLGLSCRCVRETTTDQGVEVEDFRRGGGGMVGRAEKVTAGGIVAKGLVAAGAVGPSGRVAAGAVGTAEVSRARGCWTGRATKVARLVKAGCRAAGATEVARLAEAGGCRAAGAT